MADYPRNPLFDQATDSRSASHSFLEHVPMFAPRWQVESLLPTAIRSALESEMLSFALIYSSASGSETVLAKLSCASAK